MNFVIPHQVLKGSTCTLLFFLFFLIVSGCVSIPDKNIVLESSGLETINEIDCTVRNSALMSLGNSSRLDQAKKLEASSFNLLVWNYYKGNKKGWVEDLTRLSRDRDFLILQEGYMNEVLKEVLGEQNFAWNGAVAFKYKDIPTGTLTASQVHPDTACSLKTVEPVSGIPKTILITRYKIAETDKTLLVVNLHMVNVTFDIDAYLKQLDAVSAVVQDHDGPFILAGDFNTWSRKRQRILDAFLDEIAANTVTFFEDKRSTFIGNHVDHIFYGGLELVDSSTEQVVTSDHNPMLATFRFHGEM